MSNGLIQVTDFPVQAVLSVYGLGLLNESG
jgi:hypothetical protein